MVEDQASVNLDFDLKGQIFTLLPQKALLWREEKTLIVSDIHLGKAGHFRKNGIAVPGNIHHKDLNILSELMTSYSVREVIFLGDLFHSELNTEWYYFLQWIDNYRHVSFNLVLGNHDILSREQYQEGGILLHERLVKGPFLFTHEKEESSGLYNLSGHIHPGIKLHGAAKQRIRLPCFFFTSEYGYMPAFGQFTGLYTLEKGKNDKVFALLKDQVISV